MNTYTYSVDCHNDHVSTHRTLRAAKISARRAAKRKGAVVTVRESVLGILSQGHVVAVFERSGSERT